ncbi:hypothetical protein BJ322DRAFT_1041157 [Thelephora terrestris]|uniref:Phosphatidylglycerol/phosphatidylinositol transfer protein n=1 Tax=Thelephora terrestris TaxID=56493 RepID=A0A9P6HJZ5_9AGAM|nr:hypothetical protein BJ322DRAFT_1041157 [Thelephora terrestris]
MGRFETEKQQVLPLTFNHGCLSLLAVLALAFSGVASAAPALGGLSARDNHSFKPCGGLNTILSVNISPDPPVTGEDLDIFVTAFTPVPIADNAVAQVIASHNGQVVGSQTVNVCDTASCPGQPGTYSFTYNVQLPEGFSPNEINILTNGCSPSYGPLFCFDFTPE